MRHFLLTCGCVAAACTPLLVSAADQPAPTPPAEITDPLLKKLVALSPDQLVESLLEFQPEPQREITAIKLEAEPNGEAVAFSHDSRYMITASVRTGSEVWDLQTERRVGSYKPQAQSCRAVAISPDGKYGVTPHVEGVDVWEVTTGKLVFTHSAPKKHITCVQVSQDSQWMTCLAADAEKPEDITQTKVYRFPLLGGQGNQFGFLKADDRLIQQAEFSPDGNTVVCHVVVPSDGQQAVLVQEFEPGKPVVGPSFANPLKQKLKVNPQFHKILSVQGRQFLVTDSLEVNAMRYTLNGRQYHLQTATRDYDRQPMQATLAPDGERVATVHGDSGLRFWNLRTNQVHVRQLPFDPANVLAFSPDLTRLAARTRDGYRLVVLDVPPPPAEPRALLGQVVRHWLETRQFSRLTQLEKKLLAVNKPLPGPDPFVTAYDTLHRNLTLTLNVARPADQDELIAAWGRTSPQPLTPRLYRAELSIKKAWELRGDGPAGTVTPEGRKGFEENIERAWDTLKTFSTNQKMPGIYYWAVFSVAKAQGWSSTRQEAYIKRMMADAPTNVGAHAALITNLLPRWGGSPGDCNDYALMVAEKLEGDRGRAMFGKLAIELQVFHPRQQNWMEDIRFDYHRSVEGCRQLYEDSGRKNASFLNYAMLFAWQHKDAETGKKLLGLLETGGHHLEYDRTIWGNSATFRAGDAWARGLK